LRAARLMFSGSVARGGRQLPSQMNDHRRGEGNRTAEQNSAYDFLRACLFGPAATLNEEGERVSRG